jgi:hypothetical protein
VTQMTLFLWASMFLLGQTPGVPTDFSGTWRVVSPAAIAAQPNQGQVVSQVENRLTVRPLGGGESVTYVLDGSEVLTSHNEGAIRTRTSARWRGAAIVVESTSTFPSGSATSSQSSVHTWSLASDGRLHIESAVPGRAPFVLILERVR